MGSFLSSQLPPACSSAATATTGSFLSSQLPPACSSAAPAAAATTTGNPQWTLLAPYGGGTAEGCNITGDTKTIIDAATSNGHTISVSLRRDPFSALSRICLSFLPGTRNRPAAYSTVVAAHGGSVLVQITSTEGHLKPHAFDYFVYDIAGAAAADRAWPPSLYLLPRDDSSTSPWWRLDISATGFLRHGAEAEFVVAQLKKLWVKGDAAPNKAAELLLFRHGKWCVKKARIIHDHGKDGDLVLASWEPDAVVALGEGLLCWVDCYKGVIFSDVLDEGSKLWYVAYPAEALKHRRFLCTDARGAVKLVTVSPRRCSHCGCSEHATAFGTWTLQTDDMAWVLEADTDKVDRTELWMLPYRPQCARVHVVYPVASVNGGGHIAASTNGGGDIVSDESAAPMEEEDEHMSLCVSTSSAKASLHDGLQGGNRETSASTSDQQQGDNGPATVGRWPKRRRRANSMVTGPEWIA